MPKGQKSRPNNRREKASIASDKKKPVGKRNDFGPKSAFMRQRDRNVGAMHKILSRPDRAAWKNRERIKRK